MPLNTILDSINRSVFGEPWYGSSLKDVIAEVSPDEAQARPIESVHSIIEIVLHISAWIEEVDSRVRGEQVGIPNSGDWPTGYSWQAAKAKLEVAHASLLRSLKSFREDRLLEVIGVERDPSLGTGVSFETLFVGLAQHNAYHCGQIVLLKKILREKRVHTLIN